MDVEALEYIMMIAEKENISKAADALHISQSALSQCLSKVEKQLQCQLFHRSRKKLILTNMGKLYLEGAKEVIAVKNETYKKIKNINSDTEQKIKIASDPQLYHFLIDDLIPEVKKQNPELKFDVHLADSQTAKQYILNNITDAAFLCTSTPQNSFLDFHPLYTEELVLTVPADMAAGESNHKDLNSIKRQPFILPQKNSYFRPILDTLLRENQINSETYYEAGTFNGMKLLMERGYGMTFLPFHMTEESSKYKVFPLAPPYYYQMYFAVAKHLQLQLDLNEFLSLFKIIYENKFGK